ncbi:VWA domain protein interacting with AAA ATPase [Methylibium sp. T29-B]|nr:VWA domain protein interacting with AAA ATPase [Methylibium sp. T29-B]
MLVCIDTSGSMRGAPEQLAKAVVLQAARTAHRERRACQLIAFGGAGELLTHELALTPAGLDALLDFIGQAFDGGTDLAAPLAHAVAAVHSARWQQADLLLVSDGEFGCTPATLALLDGARQRHGLRVQGVLVGDARRWACWRSATRSTGCATGAATRPTRRARMPTVTRRCTARASPRSTSPTR